ncbi:4-diphosphocytidyl-2-C-methyl-D-erythritol kinase [Mycobacteroides abscessus subsp. abscessus]|nr:4-diphosphocytidyl-2-C-methyl-D-erythritol kinase [Mycobacteroides abscessus subsp. abscessus]
MLARNVFHWVFAFADGGLSTPQVFTEIDRLRENGDPPRLAEADELLGALAAGDARRLAPLLGNELQAAAVSLNPELRRTLRAGESAGALAGIVSGSGPTCAFLCTSADDAVQVSAELAGAGVCRTVRVASGPVHGAQVIQGRSDG